MAYLYSVENVITQGKFIGLFCLPSSLLKTPKIQGMSSPCNGNHFSSYRTQSKENFMIDILFCAHILINSKSPFRQNCHSLSVYY